MKSPVPGDAFGKDILEQKKPAGIAQTDPRA